MNGNVWPTYGLTAKGKVNASYVELHARNDRLGRVYTNRYKLNRDLVPEVINDCFYTMDDVLSDQF